MGITRRAWLLCASVLVAMAAAVATGPVAAAGGTGARAIRVGSVPLVPDGATRVGTLAGGHRLRITVTLQPRDPGALAALAQAVSTPGTAQFRHYLSEAGFDRLFAPTPATVASVVSALRANGLHTGAVSPDRLSIPVTSTAARLSRAFSLTLATVRLPGGRLAYANTSAPLFDGAVAPAIEGVIGLDNMAVPQSMTMAPAPALVRPHDSPQVETGGPQPCEAAVEDGDNEGVFTADQLASAYQFTSFYSADDFGAGQTIDLFELEPYLTSDIDSYQSCYGTSATVSEIPIDNGSGTGAGKGEAALDIEDLIGLAPLAAVDVYEGPNTDAGAYDTYSAIVNQHKANVISTSWGECESLEGASAADAENTLFQQAATMGESIVAASGDYGSEDCEHQSKSKALAVDDPASQPYVTGVGGTTLSEVGPPPSQTVWNESPFRGGAGGGGISELWPMPSYQAGAPSELNVINADSSGSPCGIRSGDCREVPDVSADADPYTGYVIFWDGYWSAIGGTSASTPLFAAFLALTDDSSACTGTPLGFANPALYASAASDYGDDFNDITSGDNDYTGTNDGQFPAGAGFDMASGLGTPVGSALPAALCSDGAAAPEILSGPSASAIVGNPLSFTITTSGSPASAITESGVLPGGVTFVDNGDGTATLAGTPADGSTGTYPVTITATNGTAPDATQNFDLTVSPAPLIITAASTTMSEGTAPPTITPGYSGFVNGDTPADLTVAPVCSTTASSFSTDGVYPSSCTGASDPDYAISYVSGSVTVKSGFYVSTLSLPTATPGAAYSVQLQATQGVTPYRWKRTGGALPKGLRLSGKGLLHGIPKAKNAARGYSFTVQVVDSTRGNHQTATASFTLTVS